MSSLRQATRPHKKPHLPGPAKTVAEHRLLGRLYGSATTWEIEGENGGLCALKLADEFWHPETRTERRAFRRRLRSRVELEHPNLAPVIGGGESDRGPYLLIEPPDARPLSDLIAKGPLEIERSVTLLRGVAAALDLAHSRGLLHLELSPASILVEEGDPGRALLTDFGLPPEVSAYRLSLTPDFRSPEELRSMPPEPASNVYSLACILFACLTGEPPYVRESPAIVFYAHCTDRPPSLSQRCPGLPAEVDEVFATALAKEPEDRPQSAKAFMTAFGRAAGLRDVALVPPAAPRAPEPAPEPKPASAPKPTPKPVKAPQTAAKASAPQVKAPQVKAPQVKAPQVKPPQVKPPQVKPPQVKPPQVKPPQVKPPPKRRTDPAPGPGDADTPAPDRVAAPRRPRKPATKSQARKPASPPSGRKPARPTAPKPAARPPARNQRPAARKLSPSTPPLARKAGAPRRKPAAPPPWETWKEPKKAPPRPRPKDPASGNGHSPAPPVALPPSSGPAAALAANQAARTEAPSLPPPSLPAAPKPESPVAHPARRSVLSGRRVLALGAGLALAAGAAGWLVGGSAPDTAGAERDRAANARAEAAAADVRARNDWRAKTETAITQLDSRRAAGRRDLAAARTRSGQASRAAALAGAFAAATRGVDGAPPSVRGAAELEAALRRTERAYRSLGRAASNGRGYRRTRTGVNRAEADVVRAVNALD